MFYQTPAAADTCKSVPYSCARILVCSLTHLAHSLERNDLRPEGAKHLSEGLKANKTLQTLKYAANRLSPLSAAADSAIHRCFAVYSKMASVRRVPVP